MIVHATGLLEKWAGCFLDSVYPTLFVVNGNLSPAARELFGGFGPIYSALGRLLAVQRSAGRLSARERVVHEQLEVLQ